MDQAKTDSSIRLLENLTVGLARTYPHGDAFFIALLFGMCTQKHHQNELVGSMSKMEFSTPRF